jgi:polar amino acid transport system permease protein
MPEWTGYLVLVLRGAWITIQVTVAGCLLALVVALAAGILRLAPWRVVRWATAAYVEVFRGTSAFVQLFWAYFALPFFGIMLEPLTAGVMVIALNVGSFGSEVVRGAILAVPHGQVEAAIALNYTRWQRMRRIVLPQALVAMIPPFGNLAIEVLKTTSLVSFVSLSDLTFQAQVFRAQTGMTFVPFAAILVLYFVFSSLLASVARRVEVRASRWTESGRRT